MIDPLDLDDRHDQGRAPTPRGRARVIMLFRDLLRLRRDGRLCPLDGPIARGTLVALTGTGDLDRREARRLTRVAELLLEPDGAFIPRPIFCTTAFLDRFVAAAAGQE